MQVSKINTYVPYTPEDNYRSSTPDPYKLAFLFGFPKDLDFADSNSHCRDMHRLASSKRSRRQARSMAYDLRRFRSRALALAPLSLRSLLSSSNEDVESITADPAPMVKEWT